MEAALLTPSRPHPIFIAAAVAVILFSVVGIAAMTGVLPGTRADSPRISDEPRRVSDTPKAAPVAATPVTYTPAVAAVAPQPSAPLALTHSHTGGIEHTHAISEPKAAHPVRTAHKATPRKKTTHTVSRTPRAKTTSAAARTPRSSTRYVHNDGYRSERDDNVRYARYDDYRVASNDSYRSADYRRCDNCGRVESVEARAEPGQGSGLGAVAGGVAGALLGKQIGKGNGNKAATILGAIGGAYAGHQIERHMRKSETYDVNVRMDDGSYRTVSTTQPNARIGEQVRVVDGVIVSQ